MKPSSNKASLATLFAVVVVNFIGFGLVIPLLPQYTHEMGVSSFVLGLLFATYSVGQVIAAPILGRLSDRVGRRPILILSIGGMVIGFVLMGVAYQMRSLTLLFVSRALDGLSGGNVSVAQAYAADITTSRDRSKAMGLIGAAFGVGFVLGPAMGAGLSMGFWEPLTGPLFEGLPAYGAAAVTGISLLMAWRWLPETIQRGRGEHADEVLGPDLIHPGRLLRAFTRFELGSLLSFYFLIMLAWAGMEMCFVYLIRDRIDFAFASDPKEAAEISVFALFGFVGIVMLVVQGGLVGRLARRFGEPVLLVAGAAINAAGFFVLSEQVGLGLVEWVGSDLPAEFGPLTVGSFLLAVGNGLFGPSATGLISVFSGTDEQGQNLGLGQSVGAMARIIGPVLFGWLYGLSLVDGRVAGRLPFAAGGVMIALGAVAALAMLGHLRAELRRRHAQSATPMTPKF